MKTLPPVFVVILILFVVFVALVMAAQRSGGAVRRSRARGVRHARRDILRGRETQRSGLVSWWAVAVAVAIAVGGAAVFWVLP